MATWTSPADVINAWIGEGEPDDAAKIQTWIDRAERLIRRRVPDIQARIAAEAANTPPSTELRDTACDVVVAMVTRVFRNPDGVRQRNDTETTGPFSRTTSVTVGGTEPGSLYLTDDELSALQGVQSSGAFTINLAAGSALLDPAQWLKHGVPTL